MSVFPPKPRKLDLKRDEHLRIEWEDGIVSVYPIGYLRAQCPCAKCKEDRKQQAERKSLLTVLQGNYSQPLRAIKAELVGGYALRIEWSDEHGTGIYSFGYLKEIAPMPVG